MKSSGRAPWRRASSGIGTPFISSTRPIAARKARSSVSPVVSLTYTESGGNTYLALTGKAIVSNDRTRIQELWSDFDRAYFDSANDPHIRLITVTPDDAELWDGSNKLVAMGKMALAAVTGAKPSMGDNIKVAL